MAEKRNTFIIFNENKPEFVYYNREEVYAVLAKLINIEKNIHQDNIYKSNYYILHMVHSTNGVCMETYKIIYTINNEYLISPIQKQTQKNNTVVDTRCHITTKLKQHNTQNTIDNLTNDIKTIIDDIEKSNISDSIGDIYKEALIDKDIYNIKNKLDDVLEYEILDNGNAESDSDTIDSDTMEEPLLKKLLADRNKLQNDIKTQEKIVSVANDLLNEELFQKRCYEQEQKRLLVKHKENISIFNSDKNTYLNINSKIKNIILNINNIPALFKQKYLVINFLEIQELINFTHNDEIEIEYGFYKQLSNIIEYYDNNSHNDNIFDNLDNELMPVYESFMEYLSENDELILSEKRFNDMLNNDTILKEQLFGKKAENNIFENDIDKNTFMSTN